MSAGSPAPTSPPARSAASAGRDQQAVISPQDPDLENRSASQRDGADHPPRAPGWLKLALALALAALATLLQSLVSTVAHGDVQTFTLYYPAILLAAFYAGRSAGLLAVAAAAVLACTLLDDPIRVHLTSLSQVAGLLLFIIIGSFIVEICHRLMKSRRDERLANARLREEIEIRREAQLAETRLAAIVASSGDAIIGKNLEGLITSWNQGAQRLFEYAADEAIGNPILLIVPPHHQNEETDIIARIRASQSVEHLQTVRRTKSGKGIDVAVTISPIRDETGRIVGASTIARDITSIKRAETERTALLDSERAARAEAERASHLKDEFLATLSHELRTPLNAILGWTQILRRDNASPEDLDAGLETIERNTRVQTQIIEDLLDMSRIIAGKIRLDVARVDLASIVETAVESTRPALEGKGLRLIKVLDPHAGPVSGDAARLQQIVWNLLTNAIKFTPRGGKIHVLLERVNSHLEITVSDTGQGINPEFLPYVFDRFRQQDATTTRRHGGLGLGLSIVRQLVELHGGSVRAKSEGDGCGATFVISLPLAVVHSDEQHRRHPRGPEDGGNGNRAALHAEVARVSLERVKVLVVDDEPDAREIIRRVLGDCRAAVTTASGVNEAMALFRQQPPDVLVSDIGMPEKDGYQLIREVRGLPPERGGRTPAIALTAFARSEDRTRAILSGYQVHLAKPIEPQELIAVVASLSGQMWNDSAPVT